ncbi:MAG: pantoate--beta-alanine ligase [Chitinophagales bacterium]
MLIVKTAKQLDNELKKFRKAGLSVGFVPTMGALHQGHISLLKTAQKRSKITVCSIFVNPTQFNDPADFEKYPITLDKDIEQLVDAGCDILYLPSVKEMYPEGFGQPNPINFGFLAETLEGEHRPGHFAGMAQVVEKLLRMVKPTHLYMGLKDYQQQLIVGELIRKRRFKTQLIALPTMREKDGLAMSSRNVRLDADARKTAIELSRTLNWLKKKLQTPNSKLQTAERAAAEKLASNPAIQLEYLQIRNAQTLASPNTKKEKLVALVAAKIGGVRLIDNMLL